jgi:homoserine dehydrogenase
MAQGCELDAALSEARGLGIADGDGSRDVSGQDAAAKLVAIANAVWGGDLGLEDVEVTGIEELTAASVRDAAASGEAYRLVGTAGEGEAPRVRPLRLQPGHSLAALSGAEKAITVRTDTMGTLTLSGGRSDPRAAGAALLRDVLLLLRVGGRP